MGIQSLVPGFLKTKGADNTAPRPAAPEVATVKTTFPTDSVFLESESTHQVKPDTGAMTPGLRETVPVGPLHLSQRVTLKSGTTLTADAANQTVTIALASGGSHVLQKTALMVASNLSHVVISRQDLKQRINSDGSYCLTFKGSLYNEIIEVARGGCVSGQIERNGQYNELPAMQTSTGALRVGLSQVHGDWQDVRYVPFLTLPQIIGEPTPPAPPS